MRDKKFAESACDINGQANIKELNKEKLLITTPLLHAIKT
jgi:hypothetical protein